MYSLTDANANCNNKIEELKMYSSTDATAITKLKKYSKLKFVDRSPNKTANYYKPLPNP